MSLVSLAQALVEGPEPKLAEFTLTGYSETGAVVLPARSLQFWPETIQDSYSPNYVDKAAPGGSHPIKQWVYNSGRTISFTVLISRDIKPKHLLPFGVDLLVDPQSADNAVMNRDPRQDIAFLRAFCYPTYESSEGVTIAKPPPKCLMIAEGLGWSINGEDDILSVMTGCNVNYLRVFNEGFPRMVTVDLSFAEIVQNVDGQVEFHDRLMLEASPFFWVADSE